MGRRKLLERTAAVLGFTVTMGPVANALENYINPDQPAGHVQAAEDYPDEQDGVAQAEQQQEPRVLGVYENVYVGQEQDGSWIVQTTLYLRVGEDGETPLFARADQSDFERLRQDNILKTDLPSNHNLKRIEVVDNRKDLNSPRTSVPLGREDQVIIGVELSAPQQLGSGTIDNRAVPDRVDPLANLDWENNGSFQVAALPVADSRNSAGENHPVILHVADESDAGPGPGPEGPPGQGGPGEEGPVGTPVAMAENAGSGNEVVVLDFLRNWQSIAVNYGDYEALQNDNIPLSGTSLDHLSKYSQEGYSVIYNSFRNEYYVKGPNDAQYVKVSPEDLESHLGLAESAEASGTWSINEVIETGDLDVPLSPELQEYYEERIAEGSSPYLIAQSPGMQYIVDVTDIEPQLEETRASFLASHSNVTPTRPVGFQVLVTTPNEEVSYLEKIIPLFESGVPANETEIQVFNTQTRLWEKLKISQESIPPTVVAFHPVAMMEQFLGKLGVADRQHIISSNKVTAHLLVTISPEGMLTLDAFVGKYDFSGGFGQMLLAITQAGWSGSAIDTNLLHIDKFNIEDSGIHTHPYPFILLTHIIDWWATYPGLEAFIDAHPPLD